MLEKILQEIEEYMRTVYGCTFDEVEEFQKNEDSVLSYIVQGIYETVGIISHYTENDRWIPANQPPEEEKYVLLSFENFSLPMIGAYRMDEEGSGAYYLGDCDEEDTCAANDLFVNAWQPLPEPYRPEHISMELPGGDAE